ncbi:MULTISPECIES: hypothetical protein [unclassified Streptomyces]|uniref:hypothetical protein n=1 Tax=unclassified Streptomyces TaxID=2593676 RepID=UPI000F6E5D7B|nr:MULTISPECIES: hypothetical protein [unclassified Streptomyces]AZM62410.1 hypothetical protein DLM49_25340 [Streptomyces sp. WAC 01438]RSM93564.1 hypothetical protein DMA10_21465 [Streptomyces sp. WAC 01420]
MTATAAFAYGPHHDFVDPYAVEDGTGPAWWPPAEGQPAGDYLLAPPHPADRVDTPIGPRDRRRLELHAALTAAGIPPRPEDREAIESLSALSAGINTTIQRWLHHTL